jgi:hypothetical protein
MKIILKNNQKFCIFTIMNSPLYKIGDVVYLKLGFSKTPSDKNYAGYGYPIKIKAKTQVTIRNITSGSGEFDNKWIYWSDEILDGGIVEYALESLQDIRNEKLEILLDQ